jgi:folate-binding protein YgfZ
VHAPASSRLVFIKKALPERPLPFIVHSGTVNFDKGCYLGQELTARARFVGATRKRLMPLEISPPLTAANMYAASHTLDNSDGQ